jgi:hypothetical protein
VTTESQDRRSAAPKSETGGGADRAKSEMRNFAEQQKAAGADQIAGADSDVPGASGPTTPELTDEEVSVLCDIERDGSTKSPKQPVVRNLVERGLIVPSEEPLARAKLTALAQQRLSKRGVGLNES